MRNLVILLGRVGKDPEIRTLENGSMVATFSVATSESWKDKTTGEKKEVTDWHSVVAWRGLAEIASKYLKKGSQVYIEGKMKTRSWEKDGVTRYTTEVLADNMTLIGKRSDGPPPVGEADEPQGRHRPSEAPAETGSGAEASDDSLPF